MIYVVKSSGQQLDSKDAVEINLFDIELLKFDFTESFDYFIFTSKNAIKSAIFNNLNLSKTPILSLFESSVLLKNINTNITNHFKSAKDIVHFILNNHSFKNAHFAYFRGVNISVDIKNELSHYANVKDFIAYKTINLEHLHPLEFQKNDIFIFGSARLYKRFIKLYEWDDSFCAISLGNSTFESFYDIKKYNANGNFKDAILLAKNLIWRNI